MDQAHYFKGVSTLLKAIQQLPDVHAILVGDGDLRSNYQQQAADLRLESRVTFTGRVASDQLPFLYRAANMVVLPSDTCGEAFGMVLLEAMSSGRPVIASNLPGVRSVVSDGDDGYLTPPDNVHSLTKTIKRIADMTPSQREAMGQAGRRKVEVKYSWERIGDRLEQMYSDVTHERQMRRAS